jgi:hypothetical protein
MLSWRDYLAHDTVFSSPFSQDRNDLFLLGSFAFATAH